MTWHTSSRILLISQKDTIEDRKFQNVFYKMQAETERFQGEGDRECFVG